MESELKSKTVVLLVNLGTPNQPTEEQVRIYLKEFLSDKDVIRLPRIFWLPLLHLIILRVRPKKSAELYKKVWTEWGSPLLYNTFLQAGLLRKKLEGYFSVDVAMRYGKPSIQSKMIEYKNNGFNNIIFLPMFPQYSTTTTKSIANKIARIIKKEKIFIDDKNISLIKDFHDHEGYINASVLHIQSFQKIYGKPTKLLLSFHGIPKSYVGDDEPYQSQCIKTAELISKKLNLSDNQFEIVFQSRFGKAEWIQPYLAERLEKLPNEGIKDIQVYCPGFSSDCLETIEEIGEESHDLFMESGGETYKFIPCLNGNSLFIEFLESLIQNYKDKRINFRDLL
mgnify:FL=1